MMKLYTLCSFENNDNFFYKFSLLPVLLTIL